MEHKIFNNEKSKSNIRATIALEIFYFAYFLKMIVGEHGRTSLFFTGIMVIIGLSSVIYIVLNKKMDFKDKVVVPFVIFFMFGTISSIYTGNYRIQDFVILIQYFGIGLILIEYTLNYKVVKFSFFLYSLYFIFSLVSGKQPDQLFIGFSRNSISVLMILHSILLYISMYQNKMKIKLYPAIISVFFSFWAIGRSGIIASLLLLVIITIYIQIESSSKNLKIVFISVSFFLAYFMISTFFYDEILSSAIERTMRLGLNDSNRQMIIYEYINIMKYSKVSLFLGVPIYDNWIFSIYDYNLHNSYLRLHAFHGVFGTITILILIIRAFFRYLKTKEYLYLGLFFVLLMRISTDIVAFHGPYDPLIYFFALNSIIFREYI